MIRLLQEVRHRLAALVFRRRHNDDLEAELLHHIELETEDLIRRGVEPTEARRRARLAFGGLGAVREQTREQRGTAHLEHTARDLKVGWRSLRRAPRFTVAALATLSVGVAGALVIFAITDAVVLQPLPFSEPDRLMTIEEVTPDGDPFSNSDLNLIDLRDRSAEFSDMAAVASTRQQLLLETSTEEAEVVSVARVTGNFFDVLGTPMQVGRSWNAEETAPGTHSRLAILSGGSWQRHFARDPDIVGGTVRVAGEPWTVVGVLPDDFDFGLATEVFTPYALDLESDRGEHHLQAYGRLAAHATEASAELELRQIYAEMAADHPQELSGWGVSVWPVADQLIGDRARSSTLALSAAVALLLLLASANVSCLLLARASSRTHELSTRRALGASRWRLTRQLLTESSLLGGLGVGIGCVLAALVLPAVRRLAADSLPRLENAALDLRTTGVAIGLAVFTTLLFGTAPAWRASGSAARSRRGLADGHGLRSLLVVGQLAGALVLVSSSLTLVRSFEELRSVRPGYEIRNLFAADLVLPPSDYANDRSVVDFYEQTLDAVRAIPGVNSASAHVTHPFRGPRLANTVALPNVIERRDFLEIDWRSTTPETFRTLGTTVLRGRDFRRNENDMACILSAQLAERLFGSQDPVGQQVRWIRPQGPLMRVVGVVADVRDADIAQPPRPLLYRPQGQVAWPNLTLLVRTELPQQQLANALRATVRRIGPQVAPPEVVAVSQSLRSALSNPRLNSRVFIAFAVVALLIAIVGLYGLLAFTAISRSSEISLRIALGARPPQIRALILGHAGRLLAAGIGCGLIGILATSRLIERLLYGDAAIDLNALLLSVAAFATVAILAALLPAQRAARLDPLQALRTD